MVAAYDKVIPSMVMTLRKVKRKESRLWLHYSFGDGYMVDGKWVND